MRKDAHYTQGEVAAFLGCSRTRITEIEREESGTDYSIGELELLAVLFGKHPLDMLRMARQDVIEVGKIMTAKQTGKALKRVVDCKVPERIAKVLTINEMPGDIEFSPTGCTMASIVNSSIAEDWPEEEPYQVTILCWDTRSGELIGQTRLPYVENIASLDNDRVAVVTDQPQRGDKASETSERIFHLLVWNIRSGIIEQKIQLLDRVQDLAVSPDSRYLAAYMPTNTIIQVWQTLDWLPVSTFELSVELDTRAPGGVLRTGNDYRDLRRERKFATMMFDCRLSRFEFLNKDVLVVGFDERINELDVRHSSAGFAASPLGSQNNFPRIAHARNELCEIAVRSIEYDAGDSKVRLYYKVPKGNLYPPDAEVEVIRRFCGIVRQPTILDSECILAWVSYNTPHRWGKVYKRRAGLVNLVSGRVVMLEDQGRFRSGDNQMYARISPGCDMVTYWTFLFGGEPRLAIQHIDTTPLKVKGASLEIELQRGRKRLAKEDAAFMSLMEEEGGIRTDGKQGG